MHQIKKKGGASIMTRFGDGEDCASAADELVPPDNDEDNDEKKAAPRVEMKVYLSSKLRDQLDRIAFQKFGRVRRRNDIIEEALERYVYNCSLMDEARRGRQK
jgi:hypothetical protein